MRLYLNAFPGSLINLLRFRAGVIPFQEEEEDPEREKRSRGGFKLPVPETSSSKLGNASLMALF
jgi:hypothetical protein